MGHFWLKFDNQGHQQRYDFDQASVSIGREEGSDFHLDHPTVSRQHALIVENYGNYQLVVLSRNGLTAVDGQVVTGTVDLRPGMTVQVGEVQLGFRSAIGNGADVGEVATEAVSLQQIGHAATQGIQQIDENTAPAQHAWEAPAWDASNPPPQQAGAGFAPGPGGSGLGQMPMQQPPVQQQQAGFGQMPVQPQNGANGGFTGVPAPAPPAAAPGGEEDDFKIKSWEEIAAEAATGAHDAVGGNTDFERIQRAQAKAQKKSGTSPALLGVMVAAVAGLAVLFLYEPEQVAGPDVTKTIERCEGLSICYPKDAEPTCANKSDCESKAQQAYNVADELSQKKEANLTNRYEAYKQLDKAGRFMAKAGLEKPPTSMKDYDARLLEYEDELKRIAGEHRIRHHQFQQRNMSWEMAENIESWQAYFPDSYNIWFQEAIKKQRKMKDAGTWPKEFDPKPTTKTRTR